MRISADVMAELWSKLMVNCAYNAISGLAQAPYGQLAALADVRALQETVVREVVALAAAEGVDLPLGPALEAMHRIAGAMPAQLSSTAQDMARAKPSEIDHLNGFVARRGQALGIATPANQALYALVKLVESARMAAERMSASTPRAPSRSTCPPRSRRRCVELGLAGAGERAASARRSPAACRPTSGASTPRAARSAPSARSPSCASPPTGARRSSATATRRAGCEVANAAQPGAAPRLLGQHDGARRRSS